MKKFLALALCIVLVFGLCACGSSSSAETAATTETASEPAAQEAASTETETAEAVTFSGDGYDETVDYAALAGTTITVAASPVPHADILRVAAEYLAAADITLEVVEFDDYVQPNMVVESGEVFANFFQHEPYLDDFNAENGTHLVSVLEVHVEPMGIYGGKQTSLDAIGAE